MLPPPEALPAGRLIARRRTVCSQLSYSELPMEQFTKLFGDVLLFVYHCFDRIVILGHLPLLTRPENIVHFFRDVHGIGAITKEVLRQRTDEYHHWFAAFASNHHIP